MNAFDYRRAASVADAVRWLREDPDARLLAGGQSLLAAMRLGLAAPSTLIDLQRVPGLAELRDDGTRLRIGAMCTHATLAASSLVRARLPGLAALAGGIADAQVRARGTIGGSIANDDPAACWPAGLLALGATVVTDRRGIAADAFFRGLFETALEPDEVVVELRVPCVPRFAYVKAEQPASRFALAGVAIAWDGAAARVAVTGLADGVRRWPHAEAALAGGPRAGALDGLRLDATLAGSDLHAGADYRAHLAGVLARRVVAGLAGAPAHG